MYVIAFAKVSSFMIFQGGRVSEVFGPILHFQFIQRVGISLLQNKTKNDSFVLYYLVISFMP